MTARVSALVLIGLVALLVLLAPLAAEAQLVKVPRIGVLRVGTPPDPNVEAFRQGLRELNLAVADNVDFALGRGLALRGRGLAFAASGRSPEATAALTGALDTFLTLGAAYDAALCRLDLARLLADEGAHQAATHHFTTALSVFAEMGVNLDAVGALDVSRMLGVDASPATDSAK